VVRAGSKRQASPGATLASKRMSTVLSSTCVEGALAMRGVPSNPVTWQNSR
jgi:hypothetical protein